jgi:hypothetical protein
MTTIYDFALGRLVESDDLEEVSFRVIRSAVGNGWTDVDFEKVEQYILEGKDFDNSHEYLTAKRDEAIVWLNDNCTTDNVKFQYFTYLDDFEGEEVELGVFELTNTEHLVKE